MGARSVFVIGDVCNHLIFSDKLAPKLVPVFPKTLPLEEVIQKNYKKLFLEEPTFILVSAAKPGTISNTCDVGSYFTSAFLMSIAYQVVRDAPLSWEGILEDVVEVLKGQQVPCFIVKSPGSVSPGFVFGF
jgi:hypothetical protein